LSKRENLRLKLADAIERILGTSHDLTIPNCLRYVKPRLNNFSVRDTTIISLEDWETSIEIATLRLAKPIDQPTLLVKSRSIPMTLTDWRVPMQKRLDSLLSQGILQQKEYDVRRRLLEEPLTKDGYHERLKSLL